MKKDMINELGEELEDVLNEGRQMIDDAELAERMEDLKTEVELMIRKHPIKSVLVSAGVGFILSRLLRGD